RGLSQETLSAHAVCHESLQSAARRHLLSGRAWPRVGGFRRVNEPRMNICTGVISAASGLGLLLTCDRAGAAAYTNLQTVFIIVMENVSWSEIKGSRSAPYINTTLLPMSCWCAQYFQPPGFSSSLPNYLWLEAGTNFGITASPLPASAQISSTNHLATQLDH